jgi:hypothetical protein
MPTKTHKSAGAARMAIHGASPAEEEPVPYKRISRVNPNKGSMVDMLRLDTDDSAIDKEAAGEDGDDTDMERIAMRLDGFEMYAFLASLIAGFSFGCLNELTDALPTLNSRFPFAVSFPLSLLFSFSLIGSIFCGLYSTCVFALCSLYSKTALAERKDERMRNFLQETARFRTRGFRMFVICLMCFACNVLLLALMRL